ncbi:polysaccharide pyruvyl transferase family protein [Alteromonas sp. C1M14]|uniref:polysaccharide pyruvyl transferase family protein n=1 Tax=Alteromonas sp. C1M14 TaxID=2841567 RepID=UPI001C09BFB5|nr:polysaccharide pyruvyl transferase family protein [Alteromonas sp. C1M14]MBU2979978.1 polysaccharide pyruvyl transferase family protein [Alteromonas sp. C1M14]
MSEDDATLFMVGDEVIAGPTTIGKYPFTLSRVEVGNTRKIVYDSVDTSHFVDGAETAKFVPVNELLSETCSLSVRDKCSQIQLQRVGCRGPQLAPDLTTVMSSYISVAELENKSSYVAKQIIENYINGYLVVQLAQEELKGKEAVLAKGLSETSLTLDLPIVFITNGIEQEGDSKLDGIDSIVSLLDDKITYSIHADGNIFDVISLIRNGSCYCGSSLHGLITAMSFSVPRVALLSSSEKQINYMDTWDLSHMPRVVTPAQLPVAVATAIDTPSEDLTLLSHNLTHTYLDRFKGLSALF